MNPHTKTFGVGVKKSLVVLRLSHGDVGKIEIMRGNTVTQLAIIEFGQKDPLIMAELTEKERRAFVRALADEKT